MINLFFRFFLFHTRPSLQRSQSESGFIAKMKSGVSVTNDDLNSLMMFVLHKGTKYDCILWFSNWNS